MLIEMKKARSERKGNDGDKKHVKMMWATLASERAKRNESERERDSNNATTV